MTKEEIKIVIDRENGEGYSNNINLNGYIFTKNGSFIIFEFKNVEGVRICHIKYIYAKNEKDLTTILVNCCNFWMGNKVQFLFFKEKEKRGLSAVEFLKELGFRCDYMMQPIHWKYDFNCISCESHPCNCHLVSLYK